MNSDLKKLFLLQMVFLCITGYSTVFISYYFWENSTTLGPLNAFNGLSYFLSCFAYTIGTYYLFKNKLKISYYLSAISAIILFIVLLLSSHLGHTTLLVLSATSFGCVFGFFYSSSNKGLKFS
jgi:predicted neutral ceramidase superfamily lipid hydrolase